MTDNEHRMLITLIRKIEVLRYRTKDQNLKNKLMNVENIMKDEDYDILAPHLVRK